MTTTANQKRRLIALEAAQAEKEAALDAERMQAWVKFMAAFTDAELDQLSDGTAEPELVERFEKASDLQPPKEIQAIIAEFAREYNANLP